MSDPTTTRPRALVVFESMFGNTGSIARAVAAGLERAGCEVTLREVSDPAAPTARIDADLVVVGAPTHAFSLSRPATRADAVRQGASPLREDVGLREWLARAAPAPGRRIPLVAFDTRVQRVRRLPKAAGPRALRLARRRGFDVPLRPAAFLVADTPGPLLDGEEARAADWAAGLPAALGPRPPRPAGRPWGRWLVGGGFLVAAGVHVGIVAADPSTYAPFADAALLDVVRDAWREVFMAHPRAWALAVALGEATLGALLLTGGRAARVGWAGVLLFHLALLLVGLWAWPYALPALAGLTVLAVRDQRREPAGRPGAFAAAYRG